jgi:hypothetical protein
LFVPAASVNPIEGLVVELNQLYVYVPVPPLAAETIILDAVLPEQMVFVPDDV